MHLFIFDQFSHSFLFVQISFIRFGVSIVTSLKLYSNLSPTAEYQDTQREAHPACSKALSGGKTDPSTINLGSLVVSVLVVIVGLLTWKSDAPCIGEGLRGCAGRVSQCVSAAEPAPPHLSDDLEGKWERSSRFLCLMKPRENITL